MTKEKRSFMKFIDDNLFNTENFSRTLRSGKETYIKRTSDLSAGDVFITVLKTVYPPDGLDSIDKTINGIPIRELADKKNTGFSENIALLSYQSKNLFQMFLSFVGIPNALHGDQIKVRSLSSSNYQVSPITLFKQILKNFAGWSEKQPLLLNCLKGVIIFPIKVALVPIKFAVNVIRLLTEALPVFLMTSTSIGMAKLLIYFHESKNNLLGRIASGIGIGGLFLVHMVSKLLHVLGRAITSPADSARAAFNAGKNLGGIEGRIAGAIFGALSLAITIAAYLVLFPLVINVIATQAPAAAATVVNFLTPYLAPIGNTVVGFLAPALSAVGVMLSAAIASVSLGITMIGVALGVLAAPFKLLVKTVDETLDKLSQPVKKDVPINKDKLNSKNILNPDSTLKILEGTNSKDKADEFNQITDQKSKATDRGIASPGNQKDFLSKSLKGSESQDEDAKQIENSMRTTHTTVSQAP